MADMEHRMQVMEKDVARLKTQYAAVEKEFAQIDHRLTGIVEKKLDPLKADVAEIKKGITRRAAFVAGITATISVFWAAITALILFFRSMFGGG